MNKCLLIIYFLLFLILMSTKIFLMFNFDYKFFNSNCKLNIQNNNFYPNTIILNEINFIGSWIIENIFSNNLIFQIYFSIIIFYFCIILFLFITELKLDTKNKNIQKYTKNENKFNTKILLKKILTLNFNILYNFNSFTLGTFLFFSINCILFLTNFYTNEENNCLKFNLNQISYLFISPFIILLLSLVIFIYLLILFIIIFFIVFKFDKNSIINYDYIRIMKYNRKIFFKLKDINMFKKKIIFHKNWDYENDDFSIKYDYFKKFIKINYFKINYTDYDYHNVILKKLNKDICLFKKDLMKLLDKIIIKDNLKLILDESSNKISKNIFKFILKLLIFIIVYIILFVIVVEFSYQVFKKVDFNNFLVLNNTNLMIITYLVLIVVSFILDIINFIIYLKNLKKIYPEKRLKYTKNKKEVKEKKSSDLKFSLTSKFKKNHQIKNEFIKNII